MYFWSVSPAVSSDFKYVVAACMTSPVGVPLPFGLVDDTAAVTFVAFAAAIGTSMVFVTTHDVVSPSGKVFRPHDTRASVLVTTSLIAGTVRSHFDVDAVAPSGGSFMEPERSSTRSNFAGFRASGTVCPPHWRMPGPPSASMMSPPPNPASVSAPLPPPPLVPALPPLSPPIVEEDDSRALFAEQAASDPNATNEKMNEHAFSSHREPTLELCFG